MSKDNIKSTAITCKGYDYQTLFGISILADWLNFPDKYQKVLFEATDDTDDTPQALDDVICVRKDNKYDYYQVEYSPFPEKEQTIFFQESGGYSMLAFWLSVPLSFGIKQNRDISSIY